MASILQKDELETCADPSLSRVLVVGQEKEVSDAVRGLLRDVRFDTTGCDSLPTNEKSLRLEAAGPIVSDLKRALRERTEELDQLRRDTECLLGAVTHDLRAPMLTITGYCQILEEDHVDELSTEAQDYLALVRKAVRWMNDEVEDLSRFSRIDRCGEAFAPVALDAVMSSVREALAEEIALSKAQVTADPLPMVVGDEVQLLYLFEQLVGNALKFRGEAIPVVHVSNCSGNDGWRIGVQDNGMGIQPEYAQRPFEVFHRLNGRRFPGTGMGLPICRKIVTRHGGQIWLESQPDQGTTVFFTLRCDETSPEDE